MIEELGEVNLYDLADYSNYPKSMLRINIVGTYMNNNSLIDAQLEELGYEKGTAEYILAKMFIILGGVKEGTIIPSYYYPYN